MTANSPNPPLLHQFFQLRINQRKSNMLLKLIVEDSQRQPTYSFLVMITESRAHLKPSLFSHYSAFPFFCLPVDSA